MSCTTVLVGKGASNDGSTMIARNDDASAVSLTSKKFMSYDSACTGGKYTSVISHAQVGLPEKGYRMTYVPNAEEGEGIWGASGINEVNVAMTATETITSNERVLGADPLVEYRPAKDGEAEVPGGLGEEDLLLLILPYIKSAREGVVRLGALLECYGTYESNGIAFSDRDEIWWAETIGGHHWIARRVPDDGVVIAANHFSLDRFDWDDAYGEGKENLCSADLREFVQENGLDTAQDGNFIPRDAFGSHSDSDRVYNTPRVWYMLRTLVPHRYRFEGENADYTPESFDMPWCVVPEKKVTVEDVKYLLSSHYQGTGYDPYAKRGDPSLRNMYRSIGISRTSFLSLLQIRPNVPEALAGIQWIAFGSNVFNAFIPFYARITKTPEYLASTTGRVTTENFYWANRVLGALADAHFGSTIQSVERYQLSAQSKGRALVKKYDACFDKDGDACAQCEAANEEIAAMAREETEKCLWKVLDIASKEMKNSFSRSDN